MYGASYCGYCHLQQDELKKLHVDYTYIDIQKQPVPGIEGVPVLQNDNGERHVGLLEGKALKEFLGIA